MIAVRGYSFKNVPGCVFRKHIHDWQRVDGVVGGGVGDLQHHLPGRPRLLLLCPAHHQEEPCHQAGQDNHQAIIIECFIQAVKWNLSDSCLMVNDVHW